MMTDSGDEQERFAFARSSDPQTSHDAARGVDANRLEKIVVQAMRGAGSLTSTEIAEKAGFNPWSISPRLKPLEGKGLIERNGTKPNSRGRQQIAWRLTK